MGRMGVYRRIQRSLKARTNQADKRCECGEPLLMMGEWELMGGICPNWKEHRYGSN